LGEILSCITKVVATAFALLALAGCQTGAQQEATRMGESVKTGVSQMKACNQRAYDSDEWQALKDKLPPLEGAPSMELQTNQAKPTPQESAILVQLHRNYIAECRRVAVEEASKAHPAFGVAVAQNNTQADLAYAKLVQRQMTWGEYAQASMARKTATLAALKDAEGKIMQQLNTAHAYEIQQRQAMAAAVSEMMYQQQVIAALNKPVTLNCTRSYVGRTLNCTSY
jgi:hypothetical protein